MVGRPKVKNKFSVNSFIKHGNQVTLVKVLSQSFNQYFASVGSQQAEAFTPRGPAVVEDAQHAEDAVFELRLVTLQEIINTVKNLKGGSAPCCDLIPAKFIKSNI